MALPFPHTTRCFGDHLGLYAALPRWLNEAVLAVKSGRMPMVRDPKAYDDGEPSTPRRAQGPSDFYLREGGVAIIDVKGPLMKGGSKYAPLSTVEIRRALRDAVAREDVGGILLRVDSPGGSVSGTNDLAQDVADAAAIKPVHAFVEDLAASAALWIASQASHITANPTAEVGSIGTYAVVYDQSKAAELEGVKVHVVSTGPVKGAFIPGTEVTDEQVASLRTVIDALNDHFLSAVAKGRQMTRKQVDALATGETWVGKEAKARGLVDTIGSGDDAFARILKAATPRAERSASKDRVRKARALNDAERFRL